MKPGALDVAEASKQERDMLAQQDARFPFSDYLTLAIHSACKACMFNGSLMQVL